MHLDWGALLELLKTVGFAALISGVVAIIVAGVSSFAAYLMHKAKMELDRELASEKIQAEQRLAERRFQLERELTLAKRRAEVAEKVLTDFYAIGHAFQVIRSPMIWAGEMAQEEGVADDIIRNDGYGVIRRLRQYAPQFSELEASRFTVAALFGADSAAPFAAVVSAHNQVFHAAEALLKYRDQLDEPNLEDFLRAMRRRAFGLEALDAQGNPLPDEVKATLDGAIASIERVCRHALESEIAAEAGRPIAA